MHSPTGMNHQHSAIIPLSLGTVAYRPGDLGTFQKKDFFVSFLESMPVKCELLEQVDFFNRLDGKQEDQ